MIFLFLVIFLVLSFPRGSAITDLADGDPAQSGDRAYKLAITHNT